MSSLNGKAVFILSQSSVIVCLYWALSLVICGEFSGHPGPIGSHLGHEQSSQFSGGGSELLAEDLELCCIFCPPILDQREVSGSVFHVAVRHGL